jgi:hypothetical protein
MKHERMAQDKYGAESVGELIRRRRQDPRKKYSLMPSVAFAVEETVKQTMRQLAQDSRSPRTWNDLLRQAVDLSREALEVSVSERSERFDIEPYLRDAQASLKPIAREIHRLQQNLLKSRAAKRVHEKSFLSDQEESSTLPFDITPIGLLDSVDGYLASPISASGEMNLDAVAETFTLVGEWFPYEIFVDDMVFVIDDDGSVYVSTENFPRETREHARRILERIANLLNS